MRSWIKVMMLKPNSGSGGNFFRSKKIDIATNNCKKRHISKF
jgi:hypothetical protein